MMDAQILYHKRPRIWTGITTTDDAVSVTVSPSSRSNPTVGRLFERLNIFFYGIIFIIFTCCLCVGRFRLQVVYPRMNVRWPVRNSGERIDWHRRNGTVKMIVIFVVVIADCRTTNSVNLKDNHHLLVFCFKFYHSDWWCIALSYYHLSVIVSVVHARSTNGNGPWLQVGPVGKLV